MRYNNKGTVRQRLRGDLPYVNYKRHGSSVKLEHKNFK